MISLHATTSLSGEEAANSGPVLPLAIPSYTYLAIRSLDSTLDRIILVLFRIFVQEQTLGEKNDLSEEFMLWVGPAKVP